MKAQSRRSFLVGVGAVLATGPLVLEACADDGIALTTARHPITYFPTRLHESDLAVTWLDDGMIYVSLDALETVEIEMHHPPKNKGLKIGTRRLVG